MSADSKFSGQDSRSSLIDTARSDEKGALPSFPFRYNLNEVGTKPYESVFCWRLLQ